MILIKSYEEHFQYFWINLFLFEYFIFIFLNMLYNWTGKKNEKINLQQYKSFRNMIRIHFSAVKIKLPYFLYHIDHNKRLSLIRTLLC